VLQNMANIYRDEKLAGALKELGKSEPEVRQIMMPPITMKEISENVSKVDMISQVVPGYTVMFAFFIMISITRRFIKEKESGMLARLRSTPLKPLTYLGGMWVSSMLVVLLQCGTLLTFGHLVYQLHVGDVFAIVLIVLGLAICTTGLGLALSMWVRNENQGVGITQLITMGGAVVGGLWFPFDFLPKAAQMIGKFTPQYWAQHGMQDVMVRGAHLGDIWPPLMVLLGFGVAGMVFALYRFPRFLLSAVNE
jgi:ABC-2 type transport system permease protein